MATLWDSVKEKLGLVLVTAAVSTGTVFSDHIVGRIKTEVNKSDQRPAQQEKIAKDISSYLFASENAAEFASKNLTSKDDLEFIAKPYNESIEALRKNEYVYQAVIERYWNTATLNFFNTFMADVRTLDSAVHEFNQDNAQVLSGAKKNWDEARAKVLAPPVSAALSKLQTSSKKLLSGLSK
jgi:glycerol-3-phosphate cytidylyltransferase-like family protein